MADANFCSKCGARLDPQARFCASCGNTVVVPAVAAAPPPPAYQPVAAPAPAMAPPPPPAYQPVAAPAPAMAPSTYQPAPAMAPQQQAMAPMNYPQAAPQQYGAVPPGYIPQTTYANVPPAAVPMPYAGFWMRLGAYLIDFVILFIPLIIIGVIPILGIFAGLIGTWLYYALQESSDRQATLGKLALKIYVTDLQGRRISFGQATGRYFGRILSFIILGIGVLMVAFTQKKQGLHDMMANTLVWRRD
jgi:uncharacterized RDD family membrane protein YckC